MTDRFGLFAQREKANQDRNEDKDQRQTQKNITIGRRQIANLIVESICASANDSTNAHNTQKQPRAATQYHSSNGGNEASISVHTLLLFSLDLVAVYNY